VTLFLRDDLAAAWAEDPYAFAAAQRGRIFREKEGRRTLRFQILDRAYFLKLHEGVGWGEIIKNLLQGRLPVLGATNEYLAIRALEQLGIETLSVAGFGRRGANPARQLSFLVTDELSQVQTLEDFCGGWVQHPPAPTLKWRLLERVAGIARTLHAGGINHRDFYLCHFMLDASIPISPENIGLRPLHLMDLHRAQIRARVPTRWLVKDLGGLYFSALEIGLTGRDILRFMRAYRQRPLRELLTQERSFWLAVRRRARQIYVRDHGREPASQAWVGLGKIERP
jgi:heptose I phosphotransferase